MKATAKGPRRRVVSYEDVPGSQRKRVTLECGHVVERSQYTRSTAWCEVCLVPRPAEEDLVPSI